MQLDEMPSLYMQSEKNIINQYQAILNAKIHQMQQTKTANSILFNLRNHELLS